MFRLETVVFCLTIAATAWATDVSRVKDSIAAQAESQEYQQDLERIISTEKSLKPYRANDLAVYEQFADEIWAKWASKNKQCLAELTLRMVRPLSSGLFTDRRQYALARTYILSALSEPNQVSLETEFGLVSDILVRMVPEPGGEAFARLRRMDAEAILHLWKRLTDTIDPNWNPNDRPYLNVPPPPGVIGTSGMAPQMIRYPKQRAAYEEAIEKNRLKAQKFHQQRMSRRWFSSFSPQGEKYIIQIYSEPPYDSEELSILLMQSLRDKQIRARILDAVQKNIRASPRSGSRSSENASSDSVRHWP